MQLYARDAEGNMVHSSQATRGLNYCCMECASPVRIRYIEGRKPHFFHLSLHKQCRLAAKSASHIAIQCAIQRAIGSGNCLMELPFKEIGRIADLAWESAKIVIEVQCSPISVEEVRGRISDYESLGWQVVWVLLEKTFFYSGPVTNYLQDRCHYYAEVDASICRIYDRVPGRRFFVDLATLRSREVLAGPFRYPRLAWQLSAVGDVLWQLEQGVISEDEMRQGPTLTASLSLGQHLLIITTRPLSWLRSFWYLIIERSC